MLALISSFSLLFALMYISQEIYTHIQLNLSYDFFVLHLKCKISDGFDSLYLGGGNLHLLIRISQLCLFGLSIRVLLRGKHCRNSGVYSDEWRVVLCYCAPSDSAGGEWHVMETNSSLKDGVCHDIHKKCARKGGRSNLESTDRNCFPMLFSLMNLTSPVHSFLRVSSYLYSFTKKKSTRWY
jgi:hypothetical protein